MENNHQREESKVNSQFYDSNHSRNDVDALLRPNRQPTRQPTLQEKQPNQPLISQLSNYRQQYPYGPNYNNYQSFPNQGGFYSQDSNPLLLERTLNDTIPQANIQFTQDSNLLAGLSLSQGHNYLIEVQECPSEDLGSLKRENEIYDSRANRQEQVVHMQVESGEYHSVRQDLLRDYQQQRERSIASKSQQKKKDFQEQDQRFIQVRYQSQYIGQQDLMQINTSGQYEQLQRERFGRQQRVERQQVNQQNQTKYDQNQQQQYSLRIYHNQRQLEESNKDQQNSIKKSQGVKQQSNKKLEEEQNQIEQKEGIYDLQLKNLQSEQNQKQVLSEIEIREKLDYQKIEQEGQKIGSDINQSQEKRYRETDIFVASGDIRLEASPQGNKSYNLGEFQISFKQDHHNSGIEKVEYIEVQSGQYHAVEQEIIKYYQQQRERSIAAKSQTKEKDLSLQDSVRQHARQQSQNIGQHEQSQKERRGRQYEEQQRSKKNLEAQIEQKQNQQIQEFPVKEGNQGCIKEKLINISEQNTNKEEQILKQQSNEKLKPEYNQIEQKEKNYDLQRRKLENQENQTKKQVNIQINSIQGLQKLEQNHKEFAAEGSPLQQKNQREADIIVTPAEIQVVSPQRYTGNQFIEDSNVQRGVRRKRPNLAELASAQPKSTSRSQKRVSKPTRRKQAIKGVNRSREVANPLALKSTKKERQERRWIKETKMLEWKGGIDQLGSMYTFQLREDYKSKKKELRQVRVSSRLHLSKKKHENQKEGRRSQKKSLGRSGGKIVRRSERIQSIRRSTSPRQQEQVIEVLNVDYLRRHLREIDVVRPLWAPQMNPLTYEDKQIQKLLDQNIPYSQQPIRSKSKKVSPNRLITREHQKPELPAEFQFGIEQSIRVISNEAQSNLPEQIHMHHDQQISEKPIHFHSIGVQVEMQSFFADLPTNSQVLANGTQSARRSGRRSQLLRYRPSIIIQRVIDRDINGHGIYALLELGHFSESQLKARYAITPITNLELARKKWIEEDLERAKQLVGVEEQDNIAFISLNSQILAILETSANSK